MGRGGRSRAAGWEERGRGRQRTRCRGRERRPGGAGRELREEGGAEKAAWHRRHRQRDGQPHRSLSPAPHTQAHSCTRSHPRQRAIAGCPVPFTAHPRRVLTVAICMGSNFLPASSRRRPLQQPQAPRTLRPGFAPAALPSPSALPAGVFTTFPPGQWRTLGDEPEGAGRGGVHASPAFFLQRTLYMVVRGRVKVAPALRLLPRRLRLPTRSSPPAPSSSPRAAATPSPGSRRRSRRAPPAAAAAAVPT